MSMCSEENVYLNVTIHNDESDNGIYAKYSETRNSAIIDNPSDYEMSIIRFDMPSTNIPKFDMNRPEELTITYYYPDDNLVSKQILPLFQVSYYDGLEERDSFVWYFNQVCVSINEALLTAYNDIVAQYEVIHGGGSWAASGGPQKESTIIYDPTTQLFTFYNPQLMADSNPNRIELWMNHALFRLFESLFSEFHGYSQPDGLEFRMIVRDMFLGKNAETLLGTDYYKNTQEYSSLTLWYKVYKIVIVSNSLISRKEFITLSRPNSSGAQGNVNSLGILQDFDYSFNKPNVERITYIPTAEYRWVDLLSKNPLYKIDFQVFVQSEAGILLPVVLGAKQNCNIKFLFRKKKHLR